MKLEVQQFFTIQDSDKAVTSIILNPESDSVFDVLKDGRIDLGPQNDTAVLV